MRAIIEGINYALYEVASSVQETVGPIQRIYASGGFIRSPLWLQWLTDLFGRDIRVVISEDASAIGAALLGLQAMDLILEKTAASAAFQNQQYYTPDAALHTRYQRYYQVYAGLYNKLKDDFQTLNDIRADLSV
jgi:gluconokinase